MKRLIPFLALLSLPFWFSEANSQALTQLCVKNAAGGCVNVTTGNPLPVTSAGGGSNAAAGPTGSAVPADGSYNALNVGGTLRGQTGSNPTGTTYSAHTDLTSVGGTTALAGAGSTGAGSPRVTAAQDTSTVAGAAPLTTGIYVTGPSAAALATSANQTAVQGTKAPGTAAANSQLTGGVYNSGGVTLTNGQQAATQLTSAGSAKTLDDNSAALLAAAQAGTGTTGAAVPSSAIYTGMNVGGNLTGMTGTANGLKVDGSAVTQPVSQASSTAYGLQSAASTNATNVKNAAGVLTGMNLFNTTTTVYYLRMYNLAAAPTCSSATGFVRSWPIPPASSAGLVGGALPNVPSGGVAFSAGISFCLTGGGSSTDNTNAATGVYVNLDYQ